jgi:nicastrin
VGFQGFYKNSSESCEWNSPGTGLLFENFEFPIFFIHDPDNVTEIVNCYEKFNKPSADGTPRDWPLCAIQLQSFMFVAVDTPTCLRRSDRFSLSLNAAKVCDPLGDHNLWATLFPTNQSESYSDEG